MVNYLRKLKLAEQLELIQSKDVMRFEQYVNGCNVPFGKKALKALFQEGNEELIKLFIACPDAEYLDEFANYDVWFARFAKKHVIAEGLSMQFFSDAAKKEILKREKPVFIAYMDSCKNILSKDDIAYLMEQGEDMNLNYYFLAYEEIDRESITHIFNTLSKYGDKYLQMLWFSWSGDDLLVDYMADCSPEAKPYLDAFIEKINKLTEAEMEAIAEANREAKED